MENLIEFMDFKSVGGRRRLEENMFSVWYNLDGDTKNYGCTFSNNIKTEKNRIKIGKIAGDLCFVFSNDESGININGSQKMRKNIVFNSKAFCEFIFPELKNEKQGKKRKLFNLKTINENVYIVKNEIIN
jgi:hypothetical protein|tara:strand:+ start:682 stop:1071 length:390 start_codon:yes stop_codon:yes gene_type:complete